MLVVTSDHGENLGEHDMLDHVFSLYETTVRVPLLVANGRSQLHGEPWSTFGYRISSERLERWYQDLQRARGMGRF